jgi:hypothetical protein
MFSMETSQHLVEAGTVTGTPSHRWRRAAMSDFHEVFKDKVALESGSPEPIMWPLHSV